MRSATTGIQRTTSSGFSSFLDNPPQKEQRAAETAGGIWLRNGRIYLYAVENCRKIILIMAKKGIPWSSLTMLIAKVRQNSVAMCPSKEETATERARGRCTTGCCKQILRYRTRWCPVTVCCWERSLLLQSLFALLNLSLSPCPSWEPDLKESPD